VDGLSVKLRELERARGRIDLFLISGDVSTDGSSSSLSTALEFLAEPNYIYKGRPQRLKTRGLGANSSKRLVVAGNHDRYAGAYTWPVRQQASDELEKVFGIDKKYPYSVGFRRPDGLAADEQALIFFIFDSTLTDEDESNFLYRIARGKVEDAHCRWLNEEALRISKEGTVTGLEGDQINVDFARSIKLAVLHHHPVVKGLDVTFDQDTLRDAMDLTMMENGDRFVEACFDAGIDFILFGHQHLAYRGSLDPWAWEGSKRWNPPHNAHAINYFCCPSTSEFKTYRAGDKRNGFYVFTFEDQNFTTEIYVWDEEVKGFELASSSTQGYPKFTTRAKGAGLK